MKSIDDILKPKRPLEKKLLRLHSDQVEYIQKKATSKGLKFNEALRQILDASMGRVNG